MLAHTVVKVKAPHERPQERVIHGRHEKAEQIGGKDIGKATALDKDVAFEPHVGQHHGQYGCQPQQKDGPHQGQIEHQSPQGPPRSEALNPLPDGPQDGEQDQERGIGQLSVGLEQQEQSRQEGIAPPPRLLAHPEQIEHIEGHPLRTGDVPLPQSGIGHLARSKSVQQTGGKSCCQPLPARPFSLPPEEMISQQESAIATEDKRRQQQQVAGWHKAQQALPGDGEQAVEDRQRVESQVDAQGVEKIITGKGVLPQAEESILDPPQVPGQGRVVDAVARHVAAKMRHQRPGQGQGQERIGTDDQSLGRPTFAQDSRSSAAHHTILTSFLQL